jgi:polysaccharide export outer membrane protein
MEKNMKLPLDRSVVCLAIWALAATGCVSTVNIAAERGVPGEMQQLGSEMSPHPDVATLAATEPIPPYRVGPLDEISIQVFGREDLGSQTKSERANRSSIVGRDGRVHLPLLGPIDVVGLTREEIAQLVNARYARIVENAQVEVQILGCGSEPVDLVGAFVTAGRYYLCENFRTVGDAVRAAEGLTDEANTARGTLSRGETVFRLSPATLAGEGDSRFDVALQSGDVIHFPVVGEHQVFVFGQVGAPGPYPIPSEGLTVVELLAQAEGWSDQTSSQSVYLLRPTDEMVVAFRLDLTELLQGPGVPLMDGDRVYVAPTMLARWSWWWRQAIPSFFLPRYSL